MTQTIGQSWRALRDRLGAVGIDTAALDARLLVRHALDLDETGLIAAEREIVPASALERLEALAMRRLSGEPVARIVGVQEFYGLPFALNAATLIPRPETELLVDFGLSHLKSHAAPAILDLGTGTGCIAIALLANLNSATTIAIDLSPEAIAQARANAAQNGVAARFEGRTGNWFDPLTSENFDLIVSNPPYIATDVVGTLEREVSGFDPHLALDGGADGLSPYEIIIAGAFSRLKPGGALAVEIGYDQGDAVTKMFERAGFEAIACTKDLAGHDRMVTGVMGKIATGG